MAMTTETGIWRRYDASVFDGGTIGGRGECSAPRCIHPAEWMREQRDKRNRRRMVAYCQGHRDALYRPIHTGQRACGCHVALQRPGRGEIVHCLDHARLIAAATDLLAALQRFVENEERGDLHSNALVLDARAAIRKATGEG